MTDYTNKNGVRIWILGLHHSGTTVFWRAWRNDRRFRCFDEPLTGDIGLRFPENNLKKTHDEYAELFGGDPQRFWGIYSPIEPFQELDATLTPPQEKYIRVLLEQGDNIAIDETHLHRHLPTVKKLTPDGHVIHLYRRARNFVTSHLLPSGSRQNSIYPQIKQALGRAYRKRAFWNRFPIPSGMNRDKVVGQHPHSKFGLLLSEAGYDAERIMRAPAFVRLLAYWHYCYHHIESEGPKLFAGRFRTVAYESFATDPGGTMAALYNWVGLEAPERAVYPDVHAPKPPFEQESPRWRDAARLAGFREEELDTLL